MQDILTIELSQSYFYNAGVVGLVNLLMNNNAKGGYAEEGYSTEDDVDYVIDESTLFINRDYIRNNNIANMYIAAIANKYEKFSNIDTILEKSKEIHQLMSADNTDKNTTKALKALFDEFIGLCANSRIRMIFNEADGNKYKAFKEEKDFAKKYEGYKYFFDLYTNNKDIRNRLFFTKAMPYNLSKFFTYLGKQVQNISVFKVEEEKIGGAYTLVDRTDEQFIASVKEVQQEAKRGSGKISCQCINCFTPSSKKFPYSTSFLVNGADDIGKKHSHYWDFVVDAYLCPACNFVYLFTPLGFAFTGGDEVFINANSSIKTLVSTSTRITDKIEDETSKRTPASLYVRRFISNLTNDEIDMHKETPSSIQVITIASSEAPAKMNIIDKNVIQIIKDNSEELKKLQNNTRFSNIIFERILNKQEMYRDIDTAIRGMLSKNREKTEYKYYSWNHLYQALKIQAYGGNNMTNPNQRIAKCSEFRKEGQKMGRALIAAANGKGASAKAKIERTSYQLGRIISSGNKNNFFDVVSKMYITNEKPMPRDMINCLENQDMFEYLSRAFLIGLQASIYENATEDENK